jgi:hypothetical protein
MLAVEQPTVILRGPLPSDMPFILSSWLRSYRRARAVSDVGPIYYAGQEAVIRRLVSRSMVALACNPEDPSTVLGYVVFERVRSGGLVHYVYVKELVRRCGLAERLMGEVPGPFRSHTHETRAEGVARLKARFPSVYNPYLT